MVQSDLKAPFTIATTPKSSGGCYSFPWIAPLTLDPYLIILIVKQEGYKNPFLKFWFDLTWNKSPVYQTIGKHNEVFTNGREDQNSVPG